MDLLGEVHRISGYRPQSPDVMVRIKQLDGAHSTELVLLLLVRTFKVIDMRWPRWVEWAPAYMVGWLGAFWRIQRVVMMVSGG
jgi:hypothetical protein